MITLIGRGLRRHIQTGRAVLRNGRFLEGPGPGCDLEGFADTGRQSAIAEGFEGLDLVQRQADVDPDPSLLRPEGRTTCARTSTSVLALRFASFLVDLARYVGYIVGGSLDGPGVEAPLVLPLALQVAQPGGYLGEGQLAGIRSTPALLAPGRVAGQEPAPALGGVVHGGHASAVQVDVPLAAAVDGLGVPSGRSPEFE